MLQLMEDEGKRMAADLGAQNEERMLDQEERTLQSYERKEAQTERNDARGARVTGEQQHRARESSLTP